MALLSEAFTNMESSDEILLSATLTAAYNFLSFLYQVSVGAGLPPTEEQCSFFTEPELMISPSL